MTEIVPLFGATQTQQGQRVSGALARQMRRESEAVAANVELTALREQGQAFLTAQALTNVSTLVQLAEAQMRVAPAGAPYYEAIIGTYAVGAAQRISRSL